jgi:amidase
MDDIFGSTARDLAAAIATRTCSAVEVMTAFCDRIAAINPAINAIIGLRPREDLIVEAEGADRAVASGAPLGPLHGLPHAVKDLEPVAGLPFTMGSPLYAGQVAAEDGILAARLRQAGAILIGKTNTPEFGLGSHTFNPVWGATRNPWDPALSAGGSSGGAGAALAARLVPLADGSDYGGSLRNPAAWNNVFGFRTSLGHIPTDARDDWIASPGVTGPMARNVGDLALLLSVMTGHDAAAAPVAVKGLRIGWSGDFGGQVPFDPGVLDCCRQALDRFAAMGAEVEDAVPDMPVAEAWRAFVALRHWHNGSAMLDIYRDPAGRALLKPEALWEIESGLDLSAYDVSGQSLVQTRWSRAVTRLLDRYDAWIVPAAQVWPFAVEQDWPRQVGGRTMGSYHEWMQAVCLVTLSGRPALCVPAGFGVRGLPMGVQIVCRSEAACLGIAAAYEAAAQDILVRTPPVG